MGKAAEAGAAVILLGAAAAVGIYILKRILEDAATRNISVSSSSSKTP